MRDAPTPNPGSDEALELGCRCPVLHNAHGRGAMGTSGDDAEFWTNAACPLHGATTMPDPSPDTPSVYAPRCGHHHNPLTWLGDEHRWRCPYCFPELFPATPTAPGSSSPDTAAPTLVEVIWATLEAHGMGVLRKAELDALNADRARLRVLEEAIRQHRDNSTLYDADDFALWAHLKEDA